MVVKEPWMVPGNAVLIPSGRGIIEVVVECHGSSELMAPRLAKPSKDITDVYGRFYQCQQMVMQMYVRPEGVQHAWPYNPADVNRLAA